MSPGGAFQRVRARLPWLDHLVRAAGRYQADTGNRLAAAVSYYGFLSFFPLLLLGVSVLGFVLHDNPEAQRTVINRATDYLPGIGEQIVDNLDAVQRNRAGTGVVGLIGLLVTGLGWVDALREAMRVMWHQNVDAGNIVVKKLIDVVILVGLGLTVAVSLAVTGIGTGLANGLLDLVGIEETLPARAAVWALAFALGVLADTLLFVYLFTRLPRNEQPWRVVVRGAAFAAVAFSVLKIAGTFYIKRTADSGRAAAGAFAVVVGLMVWINLVSRLTLFAAAWTVTRAGDDDAPPSGTSSPRQAQLAGLPPEAAMETARPQRVPVGVAANGSGPDGAAQARARVAAGAALGVIGTVVTMTVAGGVRDLWRSVRSR